MARIADVFAVQRVDKPASRLQETETGLATVISSRTSL